MTKERFGFLAKCEQIGSSAIQNVWLTSNMGAAVDSVQTAALTREAIPRNTKELKAPNKV